MARRRRSIPLVLAVVAAVPGLAAATALADGPGVTPAAAVDSTPVDVRPIEAEPNGGFVESFGPTGGEHVDIINATAWHEAGFDGSGVTVGVIDFFDVTRYWNVAEHGPRPVPGATAVCFDNGTDCSDDFFDGQDLGGEEHGVAVVETILDTAPGAEILIGQAVTIDDYRRLVGWFAARGVDVVNRSLGSRYDGPGDGRGDLDAVADEAVAAGMTWVNSAGNNGQGKYYRHTVRLVGDRVAFGPSGTSTFLQFTRCVSLGGIRWANDWDRPPAQRTDYDAYLWNSPTGDPGAGTIVDRAEARQQLGAPPLELMTAARCPTSGSSLYLQIVWRGGDVGGDVLEILDYGSGIASFTGAAGSAAVSVVDSSNPGVLAVGAVDPAGSGSIAPYSSRGPSNDGRVLPDLVAPANLANTVTGRFAGTSASAAVVSGAAALLLDAQLAASAPSLADLVRSAVVDRGPAGPDDSYGRGELRLPAPPTGALVDDDPSRFVGLDAPVRALDTRDTGSVRRGDVLRLPIVGKLGVPDDGVTAAVVNVVSVAPDRPSYVQALPTGSGSLGAVSTLNIDAPGQVRANFGIVPVGPDGSISFYTVADGDLVVDLLGWYERTDGETRAGRLTAVAQQDRLLDTRLGRSAPLTTGATRTVPMPTGVDPDLIAALVVTVTVTEASEPGWVQAFPAGRTDVIGETSTVNVQGGESVANTAIVPVGADGIAVTGAFGVAGTAHVVVDLIGYVTSEAANSGDRGLFVAVPPGRAFDSRLGGGPLAAASPVVVDAGRAATVPSSASAAVWNAVVADARVPGFARSWGADRERPETSSLNWSRRGEFRAGAVISAIDDRDARFEFDDGGGRSPTRVGDLIVDLFGYFT